MIYVTGPGHGGPALVANTYLEGTYTEYYPNVSEDVHGLRRLFKQFSFPGGIPSHVAPETPGSIHEGGELGYSLSHAYGAAFDNPDLIVACVIGDGEAETGPLATSWHSNKFLNPVRDGAVLPILHLNGYKIAGPTVLARIPRDELTQLLTGYGYEPFYVDNEATHEATHLAMARTLDRIVTRIREIQQAARSNGFRERPRWPALVLQTPKGWTGPREVDGVAVEGTWRAHQVPLAELAEKRAHLRLLEEWMRGYRPAELFTSEGKLRPELRALAPQGKRRMGDNPHANGGILLRSLRLPDFREYAVELKRPGAVNAEATRVQGAYIRDVMKLNLPTQNFRVFSPDELTSNRWNDVLDVTARMSAAADPAGRYARGERRARDGNAERASVPGLARRLPAHRPAWILQLLRGVHPHRRFDVQPARQVAQDLQPHPVAPADRLAELPVDVARLAPGSQWLQPPGSRLHQPCREQEAGDHPRLPAAGCEHAAVSDGSLPAQPQLRQRHRGRQAAASAVAVDGRRDQALHCRRGHLAVGEQRSRQHARRSDGVRGRCANARDARRSEPAARMAADAEDPRGQRRRPDDLAAAEPSIRTGSPTRSSIRSSPRTSRSCSRITAIRG